MNKNHKITRRGFTLLEILLVIAAIGIIAALVLLAINPNRQLSQARNIVRQTDINTIQKALEQYLIDNGRYPNSISTTPRYICNTGVEQVGGSTNCTDRADLRELVPNYIAGIPRDPQATGTNTGYIVATNPDNNRISLISSLSENKSILYNSFIVKNGLVLHLDAGNAASYPGTGTTWFDLSGNNNNGTLVNGVGYNSANGGSLIFDGVNDRVSLVAGSDFSYGTGDFTLESWVYPTSFASLGKAIFTQTVSGTNYFLFGIGGAGEIVLVMTLSGGGSPIFGPSNIILNKWSHIAVTRISGVVTVYVNASPGIPIVNSIDLSNTTFVPTIGEYTHSNQLPFSGNISNLRIYKNKGLTSSEIQQNFNSTRYRFGL